MYGKNTRVRLGRETTPGVAPAGGWFSAAYAGGGGISARAGFARAPAATAPAALRGAAGAAAKIETLPDAANLCALSGAALERDGAGEGLFHSVEICDAAGTWSARGALARRVRIRCGLARPELSLSFEWAALRAEESEPFAAAAPAGRPFTFYGAACAIDSESLPAAEFSISVNNNVFAGPSDGSGRAAFLTAGRQDVTGYIVLAADRRDLVDEDSHSLALTLSGGEARAAIACPSVIFTWCREIRSASAGALQVVYFESAHSTVASGISIAAV